LLPDQPLEYVVEIPPLMPGSSPTLIVEEHLYSEFNQNRTDSLEQFVLRAPELIRPILTLQTLGRDAIILVWTDANAVLQEAFDPAGPWSDLPSARSPYVELIEAETPAKFFQLRVNPGTTP
jgi:hypothetical protein